MLAGFARGAKQINLIKLFNYYTMQNVDSTVEDIVSLVFDEAAAWVQAGYCTLEPFLLNCGLLFRRPMGHESFIV